MVIIHPVLHPLSAPFGRWDAVLLLSADDRRRKSTVGKGEGEERDRGPQVVCPRPCTLSMACMVLDYKNIYQNSRVSIA